MSLISEKMKPLVENNSAIRTMFEEGKRLKSIYGEDKVYDFSLGNPSVSPPKEVEKAMYDILKEEDCMQLHGYMNNAGYEEVRQAIAQSLNERFETEFTFENIIMTVGAASGLNIVLKTILNPKDQVITFAPYFLEYENYVNNYDGILVTIPPNPPSFLPNIEELEKAINERTKAVIINTPNNPTGVVYSEDIIKQLCNVLEKKQMKYGHPIVLISDEPYRELVYEDFSIPFITKYYNNAIVVYSYSKSLSLPGERIGYVVVPNELEESKQVYSAMTIANRVIGCVNAPSFIQKVIGRCVNAKVDIQSYKRNRDVLYNHLIACGFECIKPQGAFYLFVKSPLEDEKEFCNLAKEEHILMVPGSSFACKGYVRIAYCVPYETIIGSLEAFTRLAKKCKK